MDFFDEEITDGMKTYLKTRRTLTDPEMKKIIPLIKKDYLQQRAIEEKDDRMGYFTHENADYVVFKTPEEILKDKKGKVLNAPTKGSNNSWYWSCRLPLLTGDSPRFIKIFDEEDKPKYHKPSVSVLAKGKMSLQYKKIGSKEYPKNESDFLKEMEAASMADVDRSDYYISYTFNVHQVLDMEDL